MEKTTVLFRPVGENELRLIIESGYCVFPPRPSGQPIFCPVLNEAYATPIARLKREEFTRELRICETLRGY